MSASRVYAIPIPSISIVSGGSPFLQVAAPATVALEIVGFEFGQQSSEINQQELISFTRRSTASTLPIPATPLALNQGDSQPSKMLATTTTCAVGMSSVIGTQLNSAPIYKTFNALSGIEWWPAADARITIDPSGFLTIQFPVTPSGSNGLWAGQLYVKEMN